MTLYSVYTTAVRTPPWGHAYYFKTYKKKKNWYYSIGNPLNRQLGIQT